VYQSGSIGPGRRRCWWVLVGAGGCWGGGSGVIGSQARRLIFKPLAPFASFRFKVSKYQRLKASKPQSLNVSKPESLKVSNSQDFKLSRFQAVKISSCQGFNASRFQGVRVSRFQIRNLPAPQPGRRATVMGRRVGHAQPFRLILRSSGRLLGEPRRGRLAGQGQVAVTERSAALRRSSSPGSSAARSARRSVRVLSATASR